MTKFYTPLSADGTRLKLPMEDIKVISGNLMGEPEGLIEYQGKRYTVENRPCGLGCRCDAMITEV